MVRHERLALSPQVWKTRMLAINTSGAFLKWPLLPESHWVLLLFREARFCIRYAAKGGAHDRCRSDFISRLTIERPCCWTSCAWRPDRVSRPVLSLKRRLHHFNVCRPKMVLPQGFAP